MQHPNRSKAISQFLTNADWGTATTQNIAGDMSSRNYSRLTGKHGTSILMDADGDMSSFTTMTRWLAALDVSVPGILAEDAKSGLILLEDFGDISLKSAIEDGLTAQEASFNACLDILMRIRHAEAPKLNRPNARDMVAWTKLADEHLAGLDASALGPFRDVLETALSDVFAGECCVSLRDFHSENVMWLPDRAGFRQLGLLDYQDAFVTHFVYDLMSFLTDARSWVSKDDRQKWRTRYLARAGDDHAQFDLAFSALSAQRNLRILGIFARAGKDKGLMRNAFGYFSEALEHPIFAPLRARTLAAFPLDLARA